MCCFEADLKNKLCFGVLIPLLPILPSEKTERDMGVCK